MYMYVYVPYTVHVYVVYGLQMQCVLHMYFIMSLHIKNQAKAIVHYDLRIVWRTLDLLYSVHVLATCINTMVHIY